MPKEKEDYCLIFTNDEKLLEYLSQKSCLTLSEMEQDEIKLGRKEWNFLIKQLAKHPLSCKQATILKLHYWQKLKLQKIAFMLNISIGAVLQHLHRAKVKIKKSITSDKICQ